MGVECGRCGAELKDVTYRRPPPPKQLRWLRVALAVAGALSAYHVFQLLAFLLPVFGLADALAVEFLSEPRPGEAEVRDMVRVFSNVAGLAVLVIMALLLLVTVRYGILLFRGIARGHPETYAAIRRIAYLQLAVEAAAFVSIAFVFTELETFTVSPALGVNVLLAPCILWLVSRPQVKEYFSVHRLVPAPDAPPAPAMPPAPPAEPGERPAW